MPTENIIYAPTLLELANHSKRSTLLYLFDLFLPCSVNQRRCTTEGTGRTRNSWYSLFNFHTDLDQMIKDVMIKERKAMENNKQI